jgi:tetratricopeptide (TPR) repeat protein
VRIQPDSPDAHNSLAVALWQMGNVQNAIGQWNIALQIMPDYPEAANGLAFVLATVDSSEGGNPSRAVGLARRACDLTNRQVPDYLDTLAIAYAAAGRIDDAIAADEQAMQVAQATGQTQVLASIQAHLQAFHQAQVHSSLPKTTQSQPDGAGSPQHP